VESAVAASSVLPGFVVSVDDQHLHADAQFVDNHFFSTFSFPLLKGNTSELLPAKNSVALSEDLAANLFGSVEQAVGQGIEWESRGIIREGVVSGVFENLPARSSQQFDLALSYELYKDLHRRGINWGNYNAQTYVVLNEQVDVGQFNEKIASFIQEKEPDSNVEMFLQRYSDRYLYDHFEDGQQAGGRITYVRLFSLIALFILLIACINFMNLATARGTARLKEVGVRKVIGANRGAIILQYLGESVVLATLSLFFALWLVSFLLPKFNQITGKELAIHLDLPLILALMGITLFTGMVAGSYPALYLSHFRPAVILSGKIKSSFSELWARKGLVVFQFSLSIILIIAVLVVYQQIDFIQNKNLGYNRDQVLYFPLEGRAKEKPELLIEDIKKIPGVVDASSMRQSFVNGVNEVSSTLGVNWEGKDPGEDVQFLHLRVNYGVLEMLDIELTAGRSFTKEFGDETSKIIINEAGIARMGLENPVGKTFNLWGDDYEIIGVTKNFNFESLHADVKPFFIRLTDGDEDRVLVKVEAGKERNTIAQIKQFYESFNPGFTFDYRFLDDDYQQLYAAESRVATLSQYFAGIAILISCLGLFGLVTFTASRRSKEIGIRKVLGATVAHIVGLLSKDFLKLVVIALLVASPIAWYAMRQWLNNFAYRIVIPWWVFALAGVLAISIAMVTLSFQSVRAALANPVKALRDE
jgi:putative ABC transport system permease protein